MYTLQRDGDLPIQFEGQRLAESGGRMFHGREQNRWYALSVYRTAAKGTLVLGVTYHTDWEGEPGHNLAMLFEDTQDLQTFLRGFDPTAWVRGFPPGHGYDEKQTRLLTHMRDLWDDSVAELCQSAKLVEVVE